MTIHSLLTPKNSTVIFIDQQPQMTFGVASIDRQLLINNTIGLAKAAKVFNVPTILTTVETQDFSGYMWPQLLSIFPDQIPIERTSMNSWEDSQFVAEVPDELIEWKREGASLPAWNASPTKQLLLCATLLRAELRTCRQDNAPSP